MNAAKVLEDLKRRFPNEPEYHQAVEEVLSTIEEEYNKHPEFDKANLIERLVIHPSNTELVNAIGDAKTFNQIGFVKLRMFVVLFFNGRKNFFYCLMILRFVGEPSFQIF